MCHLQYLEYVPNFTNNFSDKWASYNAVIQKNQYIEKFPPKYVYTINPQPF